MDALASALVQLGGRLIVSVRTPYFRGRIKRRLIASVAEVDVPEWTEPERDEILATHGIKGSDLPLPVAGSLKNPRLLGIALELFKKAQIRDLDELSVSRLLFEHMRASERDSSSPRPALRDIGSAAGLDLGGLPPSSPASTPGPTPPGGCSPKLWPQLTRTRSLSPNRPRIGTEKS